MIFECSIAETLATLSMNSENKEVTEVRIVM
jgi:hypothetical protein